MLIKRCHVLITTTAGGGYLAQGLEFDLAVHGKSLEQTKRAFMRIFIENMRLHHDEEYAKSRGLPFPLEPMKKLLKRSGTSGLITKAELRRAYVEQIKDQFFNLFKIKQLTPLFSWRIA